MERRNEEVVVIRISFLGCYYYYLEENERYTQMIRINRLCLVKYQWNEWFIMYVSLEWLSVNCFKKSTTTR
jgi:hypothetical protein